MSQLNFVDGIGPHIQKHVFPMILPNVHFEMMVTNVLYHFQASVQGLYHDGYLSTAIFLDILCTFYVIFNFFQL